MFSVIFLQNNNHIIIGAACSFTVTVEDNEGPVAVACSPPVVFSTASGACAANVTFDDPTLSDNCDAASSLSATCQDVASGAVVTSPEEFARGQYNVTCAPNDDSSGNMCMSNTTKPKLKSI